MTLQQARPTISLIIPAFNAESSITLTLDSILAQDEMPDEILVVDDGSTDNTKAVVEQYGDRVRLISQDNQGAASARYTGVLNAQFEIVVFCDAGDYSTPSKVRLLREGFERFPEAVACFGLQWNRVLSKPNASQWVDSELDGSFHLIADPFRVMLRGPRPMAMGMDIGMRREIALDSVNVSKFYVGANDYAAQLTCATYGPFVEIAKITTEFEFLSGGLSQELGLSLQHGFALCSAVQMCESVNCNKEDFRILSSRVAQELPKGLLSAYQKKKWRLFRRLIAIQIRYGSAKQFVYKFGGALKDFDESGELSKFPVLQATLRLGLFVKKIIK